MHLMLHEFILIVNTRMTILLKWFEGNDLVEVITTFKEPCGFLSVHGTIDATQINLQKPRKFCN
jgi:hypothetical protein